MDYQIDRNIRLDYKKPPITRDGVKPLVSSVQKYGSDISKNPQITVQIVAYNEGSDLLALLDNIVAQTYQRFEIILVDNGLDKETKAALANYSLTHIVANGNLGCSSGRNIGAAFANCPLIVFVDADGRVPNDYLQNCIRAMKNPDVVAARGKVLSLNTKQSAATHYDLGDTAMPSIISTEGNSVWRTDDYAKVGGFEDSVAGGEGLILCYRMHELYGYQKDIFLYDPLIILFHDFHNDKKHLKIKTRKQAILRELITRRYPLIYKFNSQVNKLTKERVSPKPNLKIAAIADVSKLKVNREFKKHFETLKQRRTLNPKLVKSAKGYDFSVVIPCYNLGDLVNKAVNSVLQQSIDSVQIIVVDDASNDESTKAILKKLEKQVQVVYQKKNKGVAAARNAGVKQAKADYVLCLDADDTIRPTYLEKAKNMFEMDPSAGIVSAGVQYFGDKSGTWHPQDKISLESALVASPVPTASCFRREIWEESGGYDDGLRGYEDMSFWINIMKSGWLVRVMPDIQFDYFVRPEGKVKTSNKNAVDLVSRIVESHEDVYRDHYSNVIGEKHRQVVSLRTENHQLKKASLRAYVGSTLLGRVIKYIRRNLTGALKHAARLVNEGEARRLFSYISYKTKVFAHRLYYKIID